jgi:hypothetical protein
MAASSVRNRRAARHVGAVGEGKGDAPALVAALALALVAGCEEVRPASTGIPAGDAARAQGVDAHDILQASDRDVDARLLGGMRLVFAVDVDLAVQGSSIVFGGAVFARCTEECDRAYRCAARAPAVLGAIVALYATATLAGRRAAWCACAVTGTTVG